MPRPLLALALLAAPAPAAERADFARDVRPLLEKHCASCHGDAKQKAGLRLLTGRQVLKGGVSGPGVVPGKSAESRLVHALRGERDAEQMPPAGPLPADAVALIARWIDEGAIIPAEADVAAKHWAFEPPAAAPVPPGAHPVDHFLTAARARAGLTEAPAADPATLIRRLTLDLTGLPPTPEEVESFRQSATRNPQSAIEEAADRLLRSPAHGERWGRHLLDVWRYSDWYGYGDELRNSQKGVWNWRDWVVESLNANAPYDRMVRLMLAADEVAPGDPAARRATGYLARSYYKFSRDVWLDEVVEHAGKAFLGVTLNCARCHDHMYDPISQADYYRFRAAFEPHRLRADAAPNGAPTAYDADAAAPTYLYERGDDKRPVKDKPLPPGVPAALGKAPFAPSPVELPAEVARPALRPEVRAAQLAAAEKRLTDAQGKGAAAVAAAALHLRAARAKLDADAARYARPPAPHAAELVRHAVALHLEAAVAAAEADAAAPKPAADAAKKLDAAKQALAKPPADYPPLLPAYPERSTGRRKALAEWVTSPDNPLAARVFVNHVWMRHFGQPIVPTVFDFGKNGRPPAHPELLDWLASDFVRHGWDVRRLHRQLVTSRAYRMGSTMGGPEAEENRRRDPDNLLLWKAHPRPLEAEAVRDSLLFVSGLLDPSLGGPELPPDDESPKLRRSLYTRHAPEKGAAFLEVFDAPSPTECYRRAATVVPQQAMALVNSRLAARAADALAKRLPSGDAASTTRELFLRLLGRPPRPDEAELCADYLRANPPAALARALFSHADFGTIR